MILGLLGAADPTIFTAWVTRLAEGGGVLNDPAERSWRASDGQAIDHFGVHWLNGFAHADAEQQPGIDAPD